MNSNFSLSLDDTLDRQKQRWLKGERPSVRDLLRDSSLPTTPDTLLDLIYNEIVVREELGESPTLDDYVGDYPDMADELRLHFEVHQAVRDELVNTQRNDDSARLRDDDDVGLDVGPTLADYEIIGELGRGGMGIVYKARHRRLKRLVALKMFHPGRTPTPRELSRFRSEAESIARLHHANIIQIFEVGQDARQPYLSLELAEDGTLQQRLSDYPYSAVDAAALVETLSRAVEHAHSRQIVHRDLKPANVLFVSGDTPKITDFGLAKLLEPDDDHDATRTGEAIGTPRYMSPEQASGIASAIGPATDIYALGTILYECLTGRPPFLASTVAETVNKIRHEPPMPLRRLQPSAPRDLETICLCCLEKDPKRRYSSAAALADDLHRFQNGEPIRARRTPMWRRAAMWARRHPASSTGLAAAILIVAGLAIGMVVRQELERQRVARVQASVVALMAKGHAAVENGDMNSARLDIQDAFALASEEPALSNQVTMIRGWLDHSRRGADERIRLLRNPPPLFDERRDNIAMLCMLADPARPRTLADARDAIADLQLFITDVSPAWQLEREWLAVLAAHTALRQKSPADALQALDAVQPLASRQASLTRGKALDALGRHDDAEHERQRSEKLAVDPVLEPLFAGIVHAQSGNAAAAIGDFDLALAADPASSIARLLQGVCFVRDNRPEQAKVALTASIGERGRSPWGYLFRAQAFLQLNHLLAAAQDLQSAAEKLSGARNDELDSALDRLDRTLMALPRERRDTLLDTNILTKNGLQKIRSLDLFAALQQK